MAEVVRIVRFMRENGLETWEDSLRSGQVVPLFKKGDWNDPNSYRGVCHLSMGSGIVARIVACRLREWAEEMGLMDDNQSDFRTAGDDEVARGRRGFEREKGGKRGKAEGDGVRPAARLMDLRKAYPRVSKPALWRLLKRYGLEGSSSWTCTRRRNMWSEGRMETRSCGCQKGD